jgi:hypothetical protein
MALRMSADADQSAHTGALLTHHRRATRLVGGTVRNAHPLQTTGRGSLGYALRVGSTSYCRARVTLEGDGCEESRRVSHHVSVSELTGGKGAPPEW